MHLFARKLITVILFVENAIKHYYVTNEIIENMIFMLYCVITCRLCILLYKNFNISFNILLLLYGFHPFEGKTLTPVYFKRVT